MASIFEPENRPKLIALGAGVVLLFLVGGFLVGKALSDDDPPGAASAETGSTTTSSSSTTSTTASSTSTTTTTRPPTTTTAAPTTTTLAAAPTVTLTSSATTITCAAAGVSTTTVPPTTKLTWTSQRASSVDLSVDGPGVYGSYGPNDSVTLTVPCDGKTHVYTVTAKGAGGQTASATVSVVTIKP